MKKTNMNNISMNTNNKRSIKVRIIAVALSAVAAFSAVGVFAGCSTGTAKVQAKAAASKTSEKHDFAGGFTDTKSPVLTEKDRALFQKAAGSLTGVEYTPVAYLGTQVVAGTNHLFLCKTAPITPDAEATYELVKVYEDLDGNASITEVQKCGAKAPAASGEGGMMAGGTAEASSTEVTPEAKEALEKACKGLDGAKYEAKALLATQVVAGTNYTLLCKITPVTPGAASHYAVVTVYENAGGNAEISDTFDFA